MNYFGASFKLSRLLVLGFLLLSAQAVHAAYVKVGNNCYNSPNYINPVPMSLCTGGTSTGGTATTTTATAQAIMTQIVAPGAGGKAGQSSADEGTTTVTTATTASNRSTSCNTHSSSDHCTYSIGNKKAKHCSVSSSESSYKCERFNEQGEETDSCKGANVLEQDSSCKFGFDPGVTPSAPRIVVQDLSVSGDYAYTRIDSDASLLGSAQRMNVLGIAISSLWDFGDWGISIYAPFRHTSNNHDYSALDNRQFGVSLAPTYHLLKEQVHGMSLDLGARVGYNRTWFSDVSAVRNPSGSFGLADFSNFNTAFAGVNVWFGKQLGQDTRLTLGTDFSAYHNDAAESVMGNSGNMLLLSAGVSHVVSERFVLSGNIQATQFRQNTFDTSSQYATLALGASYRVDNRSSLIFNLSQSVGASDFSTTMANLNYVIELQ